MAIFGVTYLLLMEQLRLQLALLLRVHLEVPLLLLGGDGLSKLGLRAFALAFAVKMEPGAAERVVLTVTVLGCCLPLREVALVHPYL